jgi:hypothetical protein
MPGEVLLQLRSDTGGVVASLAILSDPNCRGACGVKVLCGVNLLRCRPHAHDIRLPVIRYAVHGLVPRQPVSRYRRPHEIVISEGVIQGVEASGVRMHVPQERFAGHVVPGGRGVIPGTTGYTKAKSKDAGDQ